MIGSNIVCLKMGYTYSKKNVILAQILEKVVFYIYKAFNFRKSKPGLPDEIKKILIIEPFQLGDIVSLSVMIGPLQKKFPEATIYILTKAGNENIYEFDKRVNVITSEFPWADYNKTLSPKRYFKLLADVFRIRKLKIGTGIDPRGDIRSQVVLLMIGCRERLGYTSYLNSNITTRGLLLTQTAGKPESNHRYDWNLQLLNYMNVENIYPVKFPSIDVSSINSGIKKKDEISVLIHPGAGWLYRQWPESNWVKLIQKLAENRKIKITVIGGKGEKEILARILSSVNDERMEFKATSLKDLIASIKYSDLFICLDSGPMNLAVCMDKPVIALFGPGDSAMWHPYNSKSHYIHKKENFPCNPCLQKTCYFPKNNCMSMISVEDVLELVEKQLSVF